MTPRLPFRRPTESSPPSADDAALARRLRALYAAPPDPAYWDGMEARIMNAVREGAARPVAAATEWWQALARWSRPGLAAAAVLLVVTGVASARHGRGAASFRGLLGQPSAPPLRELDPDLARLLDLSADPASAEARAERDAAYLLSGGLERRQAVRLDGLGDVPLPPSLDATGRGAGAPARQDSGSGEPSFRHLLPRE
jgi:hypothetical protein